MNKMYDNKTWTIGNDLKINRYGFGAMRITGKGIWGEPANEAEAIRVLKRAIELGVNFIDTADSYGPYVSEKLIAKALYPYPKDLVIATKGGFERTGPDKWVINARPDHLKEALEGSLKRLKLERIDLYQLHRIDPNVPFDETIGFLKQAQEKGQIRYIGLSEVNVENIKKGQEQLEIVSVQNKYSLTFRDWEPELNYCRENKIAFIPWNPIIASRLNPDEKLKQMAEKYGVTESQLILKWLFNHAENILLIPGTSSVQHLEENMNSQNIHFSQEDYDAINGSAK
ncbi:MAG TPA: aldo/keto reductase [Hanamia sp.]|jgi:aryl-alcohol dehydrogenase-like predicted oxidoreductase|nr:aldo/keto reductase [Hanamia sp.]